jgi:hypothetical protein
MEDLVGSGLTIFFCIFGSEWMNRQTDIWDILALMEWDEMGNGGSK